MNVHKLSRSIKFLHLCQFLPFPVLTVIYIFDIFTLWKLERASIFTISRSYTLWYQNSISFPKHIHTPMFLENHLPEIKSDVFCKWGIVDHGSVVHRARRLFDSPFVEAINLRLPYISCIYWYIRLEIGKFFKAQNSRQREDLGLKAPWVKNLR